MHLKNVVKNDEGVVKVAAKQAYEDQFDMAVRHGKMTEERKWELLAKIERIASNDITVFAGIEHDVKIEKKDENGTIVIDLVAHIMKSDENEPDKMNVSYAAAYCSIQNATAQTQEKACQLVQRIVQTFIKGMSIEGEEERNMIMQTLTEQGYQKMNSLLQAN